MAARRSTKLSIPHPDEPNCAIVGILEQLSPEQPTQARKIALILHGTMGHKDYLFQKRLALRLPMDSFRFDFRGNHESGGTWKQGHLEHDVADIKTVVSYLTITYGYVVDLVVGHSRGSVSAFRWLCTTPEGRNVSCFVNASGRYRMNVKASSSRGWTEAFEKQGFFIWTVTVARKQRSVRIYPEDVQSFVDWDTSFVREQFPQAAHVLTIHGLNDKTVTPYDALIYANILSSRSPGTHTLRMMEGADHNFTGRQDEVVDTILTWWDATQKGQTKNTMWIPELQGKL
ncbi:hypothetical protein AX16_008460 [Volvariella volvacea WC 439]|nr:hypothetical protein AX16_008460 [Volvariella volvacea WC 439]